MNRERTTARRRALLVLSVALQIAAALSFVAAVGSLLIDRFGEGVNAGGERLVYHTDNAAVVQACRVVLADPQATGFPAPKDGDSWVGGSQSGDVPPAALPKVLKDLNFEMMSIQGSRILIMFGGGFGHWGYSTTHEQDSLLEVAPGLWFWSDYGPPPDRSKHPYYRTGKQLIALGVISAIAGILLSRYWARGRQPDSNGDAGSIT